MLDKEEEEEDDGAVETHVPEDFYAHESLLLFPNGGQKEDGSHERRVPAEESDATSAAGLSFFAAKREESAEPTASFAEGKEEISDFYTQQHTAFAAQKNRLGSGASDDARQFVVHHQEVVVGGLDADDFGLARNSPEKEEQEKGKWLGGGKSEIIGKCLFLVWQCFAVG